MTGRVLIRAPFGCTHLIDFDSKGHVRVLIGASDNYSEEFHEFDYMVDTIDYKISDTSALNQLNSIEDSLTAKGFVSNSKKRDAYRNEIFLNGVKIADDYGRENHYVKQIIEVFENTCPELDMTCEAYIIQ